MISSWWFSVLLGSGIVVLSSVVRGISHHAALQADSIPNAMQATVRGIMLRALIVVLGLILALRWLPVHTLAFVSALLGALLLSMGVELAAVWKRIEKA
ncbi:hypothetical protein [Longimonas sp.]|uniref:hypothetical protein n=1 Tax=Longimonas sp. TaxID=2039626 RepID=UPI0039757A26